MEIVIDYDESILDTTVIGDKEDDASSCDEFDRILSNTVISNSFVYALRYLEETGVDYYFYTRTRGLSDISCMEKASLVKIFRFMPAARHFCGFVNDIPEGCSLFVTSDKKMLYESLEKYHSVYIGSYDMRMQKKHGYYQVDAFSQLPMLITEIRMGRAC